MPANWSIGLLLRLPSRRSTFGLLFRLVGRAVKSGHPRLCVPAELSGFCFLVQVFGKAVCDSCPLQCLSGDLLIFRGVCSIWFVSQPLVKARAVIEAFRQSLTAVRGVDRVDLHPKGSKTQQGNVGEHYQEHNFAVYPAARDRPNTFIEFQLTRHLHSSSGPFTVSATYKNPPPALIPEAWRILRAACACKELLPNVVNEMEEKILKKWKSEYGGDSVEVGHQMTAESGSANSATRQATAPLEGRNGPVSRQPAIARQSKSWCQVATARIFVFPPISQPY